jgi:hypothetical protein
MSNVAKHTILETFAPMKGSFCTSPRSLAVIFRGNADYPVSRYGLEDAYISTFNSLWSTEVEWEGDEAEQGYTHCYSPSITERAAFITLQGATPSQDVKRSA